MTDPNNSGSASQPSKRLPAHAEQHKILVEWNRTQSDYPAGECLHELFEEQVRCTPGMTAVADGRLRLTYQELNGRANQLAHYLRKRGIGPEILVGISLERNYEMVVGVLAVLKAGGAYLPLDPKHPLERNGFMLNEAKTPLLLTQEHLLNDLPQHSAEVVCLDVDWTEIAKESQDNPKVNTNPTNIAYMIYTSGSTGKPKGVQIEHRSVVNFLASMRREPGLLPTDVLVSVTTLSFDIAGLEIYLPLTVGAKLVVADRETACDGKQLMKLLAESCATVMQATPATWRLLLEAGWKGSRNLKILCGGEALPPELARKLVACSGSVWNLYGPTETTIWSALYRVAGTEHTTVPIGRPISNTEFYILDEQQRPVALDDVGELYIGGDGLARGYYKRPELTAEKFVDSPFRAGARLYRTGDLARYRPDGTVEFLGRIDQQVKVRGFRVELGEIEALLGECAGVKQNVVVVRENEQGDQKLLAYVIPEPGLREGPNEWRESLKKKLPDYMVPSAFVILDKMPLTPNGKVNRRALPEPQAADFGLAKNFVAPRNSTELKMARLWEEVLGVRPIGVRTSFFDLGANSLVAARLFIRMSRVFREDLPLAVLFRAPTIEQLAMLVANRARTEYQTLVPIQPSGSQAPFFCVHGGAGATLFLYPLASHMGMDRPFYGIEPEGMDGRRVTILKIEDMAALYISEIKKIQRTGPYHLGGYCFGGLVAFEMARQLVSGGDEVAICALFNAAVRFNRPASPPAVSEHPSVQTKFEFWRRKLTSGKGFAYPFRVLKDTAWWWTVRRARMARIRFEVEASRLFVSLGQRVPPALRRSYVMAILDSAERSYVPKKYSGTVTSFRGKGLYDADPKLGWSSLARLQDFEIGDTRHRTRRDMMSEPTVKMLAQQLRISVDQAQAPQALSFTQEDESHSIASSERLTSANVCAGPSL